MSRTSWHKSKASYPSFFGTNKPSCKKAVPEPTFSDLNNLLCLHQHCRDGGKTCFCCYQAALIVTRLMAFFTPSLLNPKFIFDSFIYKLQSSIKNPVYFFVKAIGLPIFTYLKTHCNCFKISKGKKTQFYYLRDC